MLKKQQKFSQGIFTPKHPEKYQGTFPITYRSKWELQCMRKFDENKNIKSWGSESIVIPYPNPLTGKTSRYFVDFNITVHTKSGEVKKILIEIKPFCQTLPPSQKRKNPRTLVRQQTEYVKNQAKWKAAKEFASKHNCEFYVLTENHLTFLG